MVASNTISNLPGHIMVSDQPLVLSSGASLASYKVAYQTWGHLNKDKSNAVLICHALTGDQFVCGRHPTNDRLGWWHRLIGPGKVIDTNKYFVIASNVLGGCMGTTGPGSINPETGINWGLNFPVITIADMVKVQKILIDSLGIKRLNAVVGGSMGGMQALQWAASFPETVFSAIVIASAARHSAQNISLHEIGRQAVMADPNWAEGDYAVKGTVPRSGLAVARMVAHITYLSEKALQRKFGRNLNKSDRLSYGFGADFAVESYLRHQGSTFVERFDANSYLYITRAMDYFDLAGQHGLLSEAFQDTKSRFLLVSFTSDWLFPTAESRAIVKALNGCAASVSFCEVKTDKGHDAFLLDEPEFHAMVRGFLDGLKDR